MEEPKVNSRNLRDVHFLGVRIDDVSYRDVRDIAHSKIINNLKGYVCVNDVHNIIRAAHDSVLLNAINSSLVSVSDGAPLAWYTKLVGGRKIERISGMDLMVKMFADDNGYTHYLLGDTEQRINRVMKKARELNGKIKMCGYSPPFKEFDDEDNRIIVDKLNVAGPDIIWVSFGGGKQERWMYDNIRNLKRGVMIGVGAGFKWFLGDLRTPPRFVQKMGLQWTFRVTQILIENPRDLKKVAKIMMQKLVFCVHFPGEVIRARMKYGKK